MPDRKPTYDSCPHCGREGRVMAGANDITNLVGSGNRVLPLRELELEIATHVGAATLKAGELDAAMSSLTAVSGLPDPSAFSATWGRSGTELTKALLRVAATPDVDAGVLDQVTNLCVRYDALYETRNDLIHSFRPGRGTERLDVVRAVRVKKNQALDDTTSMTQRRRLGLSELVDLYYAIDDLTNDARQLYFRAVGVTG